MSSSDELKTVLDQIKMIFESGELKQPPASSNLEVDFYLNKLLALKKGEKVQWKSTQEPTQTIRVSLKVDFPKALFVGDLFVELKKAEEKLNTDTEFKYKIELEL